MPAPRSGSILVLVFLAVYGYFWQGPHWSGNAHLATIRALVEDASFRIDRFIETTGDRSFAHGHYYSNKPPGLALAGAALYAPLHAGQRAAGFDPARLASLNDRALVLLLAALPGAITVALARRLLERRGVAPRVALRVAAAFGAGSLLLPYGGALFNHPFVGALLLGGLLALDGRRRRDALLAGALLGWAALSEYLVLPLLPLLLAWDAARARSAARAALLALAPAVAVAALAVYHDRVYGSPFATSYAFEDRVRSEGEPLTRFGWPDPRVLYWITAHRMRGLFVACPVFAAALIGAALRPRSIRLVDAAVVGYFVLANMSYAYWAGGWCVGPRFLIPALPLLLPAMAPAFERLPRIGLLLTALSAVNMLAVAATQVIAPGIEWGPAQHYDPVGMAWLRMARGQVAVDEGAGNLALALGLPGGWSVAPAALLVAAALAWAWCGSPTPRRSVESCPSETSRPWQSASRSIGTGGDSSSSS